MLWFPVMCGLLVGLAGATSDFALPSDLRPPNEREEEMVRELQELIVYDKPAASLRSGNPLGELLRGQVKRGYARVRDETACMLCRAAARVLVGYRRAGGSRADLVYAANKLCLGARIATPNVCRGAIDLNIDIFLYIVDNKPDLSPSKVCAILSQPQGCGLPVGARRHQSVRLAPEPPASAAPEPRAEQAEPLRVLHLTDIHYDDLYEAGSNAECDEPLCCGSNQGPPASSAAAAGAWGDYRHCDTPWHTLVDLLNQTSKQKYDLVYYTGDTINHRVWATSRASNVRHLRRIDGLLKEAFGNVPFYPILGNHEPSPLDVFSPENMTREDLSTQWLFDLAAEDWAHWLPGSAAATIRRGGYYTALVRPGLRVVALNSNVAYTLNWWLLYDDHDPFGQLQWLADTLAEAERTGERVHILSHVPTGDSTCLASWAHEFGNIVRRFHRVIAVQFNGHTHYDEFSVYYADSGHAGAAAASPVSVAYNGGSITTFYQLNPNYRVYTVDPDTYMVRDYEQWIFNMTEANIAGRRVPPRWFRQYSFREAWGVRDMTNLTQIDQLVRRIAASEQLLEQYFRFRVRDGDMFLAEGCDSTCQEENICRLVTTEFGSDEHCEKLLNHSILRAPRA